MDFRLNVFICVARNLNFTKAALELHISQPAISKHIQELEAHYGVQLFDRVGSRMGSRIALTAAGELFLKHAEEISEAYRNLSLEMNLLSGNFRGTLRVGASTTIAQYVLPELIARFISRFPDVRLSLLTGNSEQIEQAVSEHRIDIALVEGSSRRAGLRYAHFAKDELVLVTSVHNKTPDQLPVEALASLPLVLRENGSGTLEVIEKALLSHNIKLSPENVLLQLGSTESIKSFLMNYPSAYAIISIAALTKELTDKRLKVVDVTSISLTREFTFVTTQGAQNELAERFITCLCHNKKLL